MLRIAQRLADSGHWVEIFTMEWRGDKPQGNILIHCLNVSAWTNVTRYKRFLSQVKNLIDQRNGESDQFDLILGFNRAEWLDVYFAADPCFIERAFSQRSWIYRLTPRYRWFYACEKAIFSAQSQTEILLLSNQEKPNFIKWYQTPEARFHFIPPYLPKQRFTLSDKQEMRHYLREQFQLEKDDFVFLLVGSGFFMKGLDRAIRGLSSLPEKIKQRAKLIAIGQDKPEPMLKLAQQHGVTRQLIISSGRNDIPQLMQGADIYIHPAYRENTGLVILEAMACGLPVLTTATTGYSSYVMQAKSGVVVPYPFQQSDLNQAMLDLMLRQDLAGLSFSGRSFAEQVMISNDGNAEAKILVGLAKKLNKKSKPFDEMSFEQMMQLTGTFYRNLPYRKTLKIVHQNQSYFIKLHLGLGWAEIFKNLFNAKLPIIGAETEANAIIKLTDLGISTTPLVKFAKSGWLPATQKSYLVTRDLGNITSLDIWFAKKQQKTQRINVIKEMAKISATMHQHAIYHQDLYLCHFCLESDSSVSRPKIYLIDLHRCRMLTKPNLKATIKDIAALYFSMMDSISAQDWTLFCKYYTALEQNFSTNRDFWLAIEKRANRLHGKFHSAKFQQRLQQEQARLHQP